MAFSVKQRIDLKVKRKGRESGEIQICEVVRNGYGKMEGFISREVLEKVDF